MLFTGVFSSAVTISLVMKSSTFASVSGTSGKLLIRSEAVTTPTSFPASKTAPQQFKQILMVAGVEKYFQLARCYRDEDLRADRQPEFTQVDIEMSFIDREDIYALIEGLFKRVWKTALNIDVPTPFKRISFEEALNRYGIDKPDTRFAWNSWT